MLVLMTVLALLLGLAVGSFLNVVIWRLPRHESLISPGSHCPSCDVTLRVRDNVPLLSWLALRGRCRSCGASISVRYPVVELVTGLLFAALAVRFRDDAILFVAFAYLAAVGVALGAIDIDIRRLPNALTLPSYVVGLVLLGGDALRHAEYGPLPRALAGMAILYVFYFLLAVIKPGGMGFGDVKLAGVLGLFLGYLGWGQLAAGAFLGFLIGGLAGVALMAVRRAGRKTKIPYGPYMIAGALVAVFAGHWLTEAYLTAIGAR
jgi:leader peptidase (prepilin peptidase) / N-methyltransferase